MIYLDYNATAPMLPEVKEAMAAAMDEPLNPSSVHTIGRKAKKLLEESRQQIADHLSCFPQEVIFTASGTESNNMALRSAGDRPILVGATEHYSIDVPARQLGADTLPVDRNGIIDLDIVESKLKALGRPAFVSVMLANNETGVIQPVAELAKLAKRYDALVHCDAVQVVGKRTLDINLLCVDMLTIGAHKMGGPIGIAALLVRQGIEVRPFIVGGNQELGRRAGTESVHLVAGFAMALNESLKYQQHFTRLGTLIRGMEERLRTVADIEIAGAEVERMPHASCILLSHVSSETQLMHMDLNGFCLSTGSACSSGRITPSSVLKAMGYSDAMAGSVLRMSAGWNTQDNDLAQFEQAWSEMAERLQQKAA